MAGDFEGNPFADPEGINPFAVSFYVLLIFRNDLTGTVTQALAGVPKRLFKD